MGNDNKVSPEDLAFVKSDKKCINFHQKSCKNVEIFSRCQKWE